MTSLTNRILAGIQKLGCECSEICKTCIHLNVPAEESPCKGCKYGSLGGSKDNYSKRVVGRERLISSTKTMTPPKTPPVDNENSGDSYGGSGNVGNTPPSITEKRAYENSVLLKVLRSLKK